MPISFVYFIVYAMSGGTVVIERPSIGNHSQIFPEHKNIIDFNILRVFYLLTVDFRGGEMATMVVNF